MYKEWWVSAQLSKGDLVEVRTAEEILLTLDERGELAGQPFMPEMIAFIGRRYRVVARAERVCDTIGYGHTRRMVDTVLLDAERCDGTGHGGCQAECRVYWHTAWLKPVTGGSTTSRSAPAALERLRALVMANASRVDDEGVVRYRCQATQALASSIGLSPVDPRSYARTATAGNVSFGHFVRVMARAVAMEGKKLAGNRGPVLSGPTTTTPKTPPLHLQPGERVRVKAPDQIAATLTKEGKNRGLGFDVEMMVYCGQEFYVRRRVERLVDETDGHMIELSTDCIMLEGGVCSGEYSLGRWLCPRAIYSYWREAWLERVDQST
jgi:hypothetical protein